MIRKLRAEEWPRYRALRLESLELAPEAFGASLASTRARPESWWIERLEAAQADPKRALLFAESGDALVGMIGAYPDESPGVVNVISMYVSPAARGTGIARELLRTLVAELRAAEPTTEIRLTVRPTQVPAYRLYRSFGFVPLLLAAGNPAEISPNEDLVMRFA